MSSILTPLTALRADASPAAASRARGSRSRRSTPVPVRAAAGDDDAKSKKEKDPSDMKAGKGKALTASPLVGATALAFPRATLVPALFSNPALPPQSSPHSTLS